MVAVGLVLCERLGCYNRSPLNIDDFWQKASALGLQEEEYDKCFRLMANGSKSVGPQEILDFLAKAPWPPSRVVSMLCQLAEVLEEAKASFMTSEEYGQRLAQRLILHESLLLLTQRVLPQLRAWLRSLESSEKLVPPNEAVSNCIQSGTPVVASASVMQHGVLSPDPPPSVHCQIDHCVSFGGSPSPSPFRGDVSLCHSIFTVDNEKDENKERSSEERSSEDCRVVLDMLDASSEDHDASSPSLSWDHVFEKNQQVWSLESRSQKSQRKIQHLEALLSRSACNRSLKSLRKMPGYDTEIGEDVDRIHRQLDAERQLLQTIKGKLGIARYEAQSLERKMAEQFVSKSASNSRSTIGIPNSSLRSRQAAMRPANASWKGLRQCRSSSPRLEATAARPGASIDGSALRAGPNDSASSKCPKSSLRERIASMSQKQASQSHGLPTYVLSSSRKAPQVAEKAVISGRAASMPVRTPNAIKSPPSSSRTCPAAQREDPGTGPKRPLTPVAESKHEDEVAIANLDSLPSVAEGTEKLEPSSMQSSTVSLHSAPPGLHSNASVPLLNFSLLSERTRALERSSFSAPKLPEVFGVFRQTSEPMRAAIADEVGKCMSEMKLGKRPPCKS